MSAESVARDVLVIEVLEPELFVSRESAKSIEEAEDVELRYDIPP